MNKCSYPRVALLLTILVCFASNVSAQLIPFVIPGDDSTPTIVDQSGSIPKPAGKSGFVRVQDGKFYTGDKRIKFWGMNMCFGANFPTHEEADKVAPHLAKLGVNAVRFHHMDMNSAPGGIWSAEYRDVSNTDGTTTTRQRQFDPEMIDRLDYFLSKLHELGIYADLNLHVSRTLSQEEGYPKMVDGPWWAGANKYVMYYDRDVQAEVKRYCHDLLLHKNPYRNNIRRVDDPGVAIVEMLNENYFSRQGFTLVPKLPSRFQESLKKRWNEWLLAKYGNTEKLRMAWAPSAKDLVVDAIPIQTWEKELGPWTLSLDETELPRQLGVEGPSSEQLAVAGEKSGFKALRLIPKKAYEADWKQQLRVTGISSRKGSQKTLSFWVRSDSPRTVRLEQSSLSGGQWQSIGLAEELTLSPKWTQIVRAISEEVSINNEVFLAFNFGHDATPLEFAGIRMTNSSQMSGISDGQSLEAMNVDIAAIGFPAIAIDDMNQFMIDTEREWITELKNYVTKELGVRVPVTASQVNYHPAGIVEELLDFADLHDYWHHPTFPPGKDWSAEGWIVGNDPMEANPTQHKWPRNSLLMRAGWRVDGMPFTATEWNYPEPGMYSAGCVPMAAMVGALQDWDAVFFFDYEAFGRDGDQTTSPYFKNQTNNFFSFNGSPAKLAAFSIFSNVFRRGDLAALKKQYVGPASDPIDGRFALSARLASRSNAPKPELPELPPSTLLETPDKSVVWKSSPEPKPVESKPAEPKPAEPKTNESKPEEPKKAEPKEAELIVAKAGTIQLTTDATVGVWGLIANQSFNVGNETWSVGNIDHDYGILVATSVTGEPLKNSRRTVLLAATRNENEGMGWNAEHNSIGTNWGHGPSLIAPIEATIRIPTTSKRVVVSALDGAGKPKKVVASKLVGGVVEFKIDGTYETLWYSIEGTEK